MIKVTKMNGEEIVINAELIETIRATPDTVICLTTEKKILVLDEVDDLIDKVKEYKREILGNRGVN